jgi:hypothetical protein
MNTQHERSRTKDRHRQGQTLAEFALTLPVLLLLLFGIVEFGRVFQAWVTLQNSARVAARYASTGQWNQEKYSEDYKIAQGWTDADPEWGDAVPLVPCSQDEPANTNPVLILTNLTRFNVADMESPFNTATYDVVGYADTGGAQSEHLYNTMYGVPNCDPSDPDTLQFRQDIMRLVSIYDEARRGAAGLSIEPTRVEATPQSIWDYVMRSFQRPSPHDVGTDVWDHEVRGWFDVNICSSRPKMHPDTHTELDLDAPSNMYSDVPTGLTQDGARFWTVPPDVDNDNLPPGTCILLERPTATGIIDDYAFFASGNVTNVGVPWLDAGSSGDRVTITITFNHPLITPLPLGDFIQMQARRSAVNESFRVSNAERALGPSGAGLGALVPTAPAETNTPAPTSTIPDTSTPTETYTPENTPTEEPFDCAKLYVGRVQFNQNRFFIDFENGNPQETQFLGSVLYWRPEDFIDVNPSIVLENISVNNEIVWFAGDTPQVSPVDTALYPPSDPGLLPGEFYISGGGAVSQYQGTFSIPPQQLFEYTDMWAFTGSIFRFDDLNGGTCDIIIDLPPTPPPPTDFPPDFTPSATWTPNCASTAMSVEFVSFDSLGDVRIRVTNNRSVNSPMYGALIHFEEFAGLGLTKIVAGGSNANDTVATGGQGVVVWNSGISTGITSSPVDTYSSGTWQVDYVFPPSSVTDLHLDFTGVGASTLPGAIPGYDKSAFNGSRFDITCGGGSTGGSGGGPGTGGDWGSSGPIFLFNNPTPAPTSPPLPTRTPGPTATPSNTPLPVTPSNTWTPRPATATFTPSNTPVPSATEPPTATKTPFGVDGSG